MSGANCGSVPPLSPSVIGIVKNPASSSFASSWYTGRFVPVFATEDVTLFCGPAVPSLSGVLDVKIWVVCAIFLVATRIAVSAKASKE